MERYPVHDILDRYLPIKDIYLYYEGIDENSVVDLVKSGKVRYAELKEINGTRRVPQVDMLEVLTVLERDTTLHHLIHRGESDE